MTSSENIKAPMTRRRDLRSCRSMRRSTDRLLYFGILINWLAWSFYSRIEVFEVKDGRQVVFESRCLEWPRKLLCCGQGRKEEQFNSKSILPTWTGTKTNRKAPPSLVLRNNLSVSLISTQQLPRKVDLCAVSMRNFDPSRSCHQVPQPFQGFQKIYSINAHNTFSSTSSSSSYSECLSSSSSSLSLFHKAFAMRCRFRLSFCALFCLALFRLRHFKHDRTCIWVSVASISCFIGEMNTKSMSSDDSIV